MFGQVPKLLFGLILIMGLPVWGREPLLDSLRFESLELSTAVDSPAICRATHDIGRMMLGVSNNGTFGRAYAASRRFCFGADDFLGGCQFPKESIWEYLAGGALWIGAIVNRDTLVSIGGALDYASGNSLYAGGELFPDASPDGEMQLRSTRDPTRPEYDGAVSEQDFIAVYTDTCTACPGMTKDRMDFRSHRPMKIEVTQRS